MSVVVDKVFGCVLWTGRKDKDGYGLNGRRRVHIAAWEEAFGPMPDGFEAEHTCRRRNCLLVAHLEAVTRSENEKRKSWRYRSRMKMCSKGHSLNGALVTPEGGRLCRTCHQERTQ